MGKVDDTEIREYEEAITAESSRRENEAPASQTRGDGAERAREESREDQKGWVLDCGQLFLMNVIRCGSQDCILYGVVCLSRKVGQFFWSQSSLDNKVPCPKCK